MKKLKKTILLFTPPIIIYFIKVLKKKIFSNKQNLSNPLLQIIQSKKYDDSLVIGNGPSFNDFIRNNLSLIKDKNIICINSFANSEYYESLKPAYYVFADPAFWNKKNSNVLKLLVETIKKNIIEKTTWPLTIILPIDAKKWNPFNEILPINKNINIVYTNNNIDESTNKFENYKQGKTTLYYQTVLVSAIFFSLNIGSKKTYLVGGDLSLHENLIVTENNIVCNKENHFYKDEDKIKPFWKNVENTETFTMSEILQAFSRMFKGFEELEAYSKYLGVKIYNASEKSYIDAFERIKK